MLARPTRTDRRPLRTRRAAIAAPSKSTTGRGATRKLAPPRGQFGGHKSVTTGPRDRQRHVARRLPTEPSRQQRSVGRPGVSAGNDGARFGPNQNRASPTKKLRRAGRQRASINANDCASIGDEYSGLRPIERTRNSSASERESQIHSAVRDRRSLLRSSPREFSCTTFSLEFPGVVPYQDYRACAEQLDGNVAVKRCAAKNPLRELLSLPGAFWP